MSTPAWNTFHTTLDTISGLHPDGSECDSANTPLRTITVRSKQLNNPRRLTQEYNGDRNSLGTSTALFLRSSDAGIRCTICALRLFELGQREVHPHPEEEGNAISGL